MIDKVIIVLIVFLTGVYSGYYITDDKWQSKWDKAESEAAQNQMRLVDEIVLKYNTKIEQLEKANELTKQELNKNITISNNLDVANDRLQEQYRASLSATPACDKPPSTKRGIDTETTRRELQADMFRVVSNRAAEYAKIADENRIRGVSCQNDYEILLRSYK